MTTKEVNEDEAAKAEVSQQGDAPAATYKNKRRDEELAALARAKEVIVETTGGSAAAFIRFAPAGASTVMRQ